MKRIALSVFALLAASCASTPGPESGVRLYALDCGSFDMKNTGLFSPNHEYDGKPGKLSDPCFLIRHPKGDLVWDAGIPPSMATRPGQTLATMTYRAKLLAPQ